MQIELQFYQHRYVYNFYQLDMSTISISLICLHSISLICLQFLSAWYASILSAWCVLDIYQLDIFWIFINIDMSTISISLICLHSISLICLQFLSTWYVYNFYQLDMPPFYQLDVCWISINLIYFGYLSTLICFGCLSKLIELSFLSTWYASKIYQCWYASKIYQLNMFWIFIRVDRTPNFINLISLGYLFVLIELQFLSTW
jgi:hypothetical protein